MVETGVHGSPRIVFVGGGAIGSYAAAHLARAGKDVTVIDGYGDHVAAIARNGITVAGMTDEDRFTTPVAAIHVDDVGALASRPPCDIAVIAVKSYDSEWAAELVRPWLAPDAIVVSMQNGINEHRIAAVVGADRVLGSVVGIGVELREPGVVMRTNFPGSIPNTFTNGELDGRMTPRLAALTDLLGAIDTSESTDDLMGERWTKLCVNVMRNAVSAASGLGVNDCDADPIIRRFSYRLVAEAVAVADRLGHRLKRATNLDLRQVAEAGRGDPVAIAAVDAVLERARASYRSNAARPSMMQDIVKGRPTEIGQINGFICEQAASVGLSAPLNAAIVDLVEHVASGHLAASPQLVHDLAASEKGLAL